MSLINDALKRATRSQPTAAAAPAPEPAAPMQPVEYRKSGGLPWYFFPALLAIIAAACWFIVKGIQARQQSSSPVPQPITVKAREPEPQPPTTSAPSAPGAEASTTLQATPTSPAAPNGGATPEAAPTTTAATAIPTATAAAPAPPPEPPKPAYKLQGIFFRSANPSAIINGKSVWVGTRIDGATVKTITRDTLTIEVNGQTTVLTLE